MGENQISSRLAWLSSALAVQRNNIATVLLRLKCIGMRASTSFALHRKFINLLEQVATDKEKELGIINEIEAVEKHHQLMKQLKLLRRAEPEGAPRTTRLPEPAREKPQRRSLTKIFWILYLLSLNKINNKKQSLTVN
jgi:hypothetical protein